jgi:hypothetical protein
MARQQDFQQTSESSVFPFGESSYDELMNYMRYDHIVSCFASCFG